MLWSENARALRPGSAKASCSAAGPEAAPTLQPAGPRQIHTALPQPAAPRLEAGLGIAAVWGTSPK